MDIITRLRKLNIMYDDLYEQEMLIERRMEIMSDERREKVKIDLEAIKADMKKIQDKILLLV